jgi:hypothetical protein
VNGPDPDREPHVPPTAGPEEYFDAKDVLPEGSATIAIMILAICIVAFGLAVWWL